MSLATKMFWSTAAALVCSSATARAQQATPPHREHVRFSYRAPDGCPTEGDFLDRVRERHAELIADPEAARTLAVFMLPPSSSSQKWQGSLGTEGIASGKATRTVDGDSCDEVARKIAIFTAIALREGAVDELPPAHPELATPDVPEQPRGNFLPMAPPPIRHAPYLDLHADRFALTLKTLLATSNGEGAQYGVGLAATQFLSPWFGVSLEGTWVHDLGPGQDDGNIVFGRALVHLEFEAIHAHGTLTTDHGNVIDWFIEPGIGATLTRPRHPANDDYGLDTLFDLGMGVRVFVTRSIALTFETNVLAYNQHDYPGADSSLAVAPTAQIGFTWFLSPARKWNE